jgi:uncharacterized protein
MRTCAGCRAVDAQSALVRLAYAGPHLVVGRGPGRGAYIHARPACLDSAVRGGLARTLRRAVSATEVRSLAIHLSPTVDNPSANRPGLVGSEAVETAQTSGASKG